MKLDNDNIKYILLYIWYSKWKILFTSIAVIGMSIGVMRIISLVEIALIPEKEKPPLPQGFYEWEKTNETFLKRLNETIFFVGEKGNGVVFIGSIFTPQEAITITKEEVAKFNHRVEMKHADFNAGILAKISPMFRYRLEAYLLKENFIILVPAVTDITNFFKNEEVQKII